MVGVALILTSPAYPWYTELVVALAALAGRAEWLPLGVAAYLPLFGGAAGLSWTQGIVDGYVTAAAVAIDRHGGASRAWQAQRRRAAGGPAADPARHASLQPSGDNRAPGRRPDGRGLHGWAPMPGVSSGRGAAPAAGGRSEASRASACGGLPWSPTWCCPALTRLAALPYVLGRLPAGYRAIVVDNGSSDGSAEIASRLGAQVVLEPRRGFGAACHAGLRAASADVVCFCDCDGSLDPAELPMVVGPILDGDADLVLGRRRPRSIRAWPPHARIANLLLARRIRRATGAQLRDLGPMRAARREWLLALGLRDRRFGYPLEMVLAAARAGWRITETDVCYVPRTGRSKVTGTLAGTLRAVRDMRKAWKAATG